MKSKEMGVVIALCMVFSACGSGDTLSNLCAVNDDCIDGYLCIEKSCRVAEGVSVATRELPTAYVDAEYSFSLSAEKGVPPYHWTLLAGPSWMKLNSDTGLLSGMPKEEARGVEVKVRVNDSTSGRSSSAEAAFTINIFGCTDGQEVVCYQVDGEACMVGQKTCYSGEWGECQDLEFSIDSNYCGSDCSSCPTETADRCRQGQCVCGPEGNICVEGEICCNKKCVDKNSVDNCGSCGRACAEILPHAENVRCEEGNCFSDGCSAGYIDCDDNPFNGCDTEISVTACGECGRDCTVQVEHVQQVECQSDSGSYACGYSGQGNTGEGCELGWLDCDGDRTNGCETKVDKSNCGACDVYCASVCELDQSGDHYWCTCHEDSDCGSEALCCDGECLSANDLSHCGSCNNDCTATVEHASPVCAAGQCFHGPCEQGWLDCDNNAANGCETPYSNENCGQCGFNCGQNAVCNEGSCACVATFGNCIDGWADGCETNLQTTVAHCGSCGHDCNQDLQHVNGPLCQSGQCNYTSCQNGFGDCDTNRTNGCEENIWELTDCGTNCGNRRNCQNDVQNAYGIICSSGSCDYDTCRSSFADCDHVRTNGCEVNIWLPAACGTSCDNRVNCNQVVQHARGITCTSGACDFQNCEPGYGSCDNNRANGCEKYLWDVLYCGTACDNLVKCSGRVQNASGIFCNQGSCDFQQCNTGFLSCDNDRSNGCETNIQNNPANCGGCGNSCGQNASCSSGSCVCNSNWGNCDSLWSNGCEANLLDTVEHCGNCSTNCNVTVQNASGRYCSNGACNYGSCNSGYGDCDNNRANGCEAQFDIPTSCGTSCSNRLNCTTLPHTKNQICFRNSCSFSCVTGWYNCDGLASNGCEANYPCP